MKAQTNFMVQLYTVCFIHIYFVSHLSYAGFACAKTKLIMSDVLLILINFLLLIIKDIFLHKERK